MCIVAAALEHFWHLIIAAPRADHGRGVTTVHLNKGGVPVKQTLLDCKAVRNENPPCPVGGVGGNIRRRWTIPLNPFSALRAAADTTCGWNWSRWSGYCLATATSFSNSSAPNSPGNV